MRPGRFRHNDALDCPLQIAETHAQRVESLAPSFSALRAISASTTIAIPRLEARG
jgi:hypothetical protein